MQWLPIFQPNFPASFASSTVCVRHFPPPQFASQKNCFVPVGPFLFIYWFPPKSAALHVYYNRKGERNIVLFGSEFEIGSPNPFRSSSGLIPGQHFEIWRHMWTARSTFYFYKRATLRLLRRNKIEQQVLSPKRFSFFFSMKFHTHEHFLHCCVHNKKSVLWKCFLDLKLNLGHFSAINSLILLEVLD